jgi:hypothetical protein
MCGGGMKQCKYYQITPKHSSPPAFLHRMHDVPALLRAGKLLALKIKKVESAKPRIYET